MHQMNKLLLLVSSCKQLPRSARVVTNKGKVLLYCERLATFVICIAIFIFGLVMMIRLHVLTGFFFIVCFFAGKW